MSGRSILRVIAAVVSLAFVMATAWAMTVTGILEPASLDVPHFDAGAGNMLLIARFFLSILTLVLLLLLAFMARGGTSTRWLFGLAGLAAVPVFLWSCFSIERWAPNFSEHAYDSILQSVSNHQPMPVEAVLSTLGPPLLKGTSLSGGEAWSYSYMPSGGFGWKKRMLLVKEGFVVSGYSLDEP